MVTEIKKGDFEEDVIVQERFVGESPAKSTKVAADLTFTDVTEGGIPITKAESIARKNVEAMGEVFEPVKDYVINPIYKAWDKVGRRVVDKLNPLDTDFFENRKDQSEQIELQKRKAYEAYREKREQTQDMLGILLDKYKTKSEEVRATEGDEAAESVLQEYFNAKGRLLESANLLETDLQGTPIDLDTYMLRDDMDLWTDNPDPYPYIQFGEKFAATVYGTNKGFKAGEKLLTNKNIQKLNKVFKAAGGKGPWYVRLGAWAGRGATHPWTIKTVSGLGLGGAGWGAADFGYELQLDAMNAAGKGKAYLESNDDVRAQMLSKAIPEFLTFGPEGINCPGLAQRTFNAMDEAVVDATLSAPFFALRPVYNGLRTAVSKSPGIKMFKDPGKPMADFGETTSLQDLASAEHLWKKWGGDLAKSEKAGFNVPFIGNALTRVAQSNVFDWISTGGLSLIPKLTGKGKGFETYNPVRPQEQVILPMGKYMFSDAFISFTSKVLGRAPWLGGLIGKNLQNNSHGWAMVFNNMLGDMAPISHLMGNNALRFGDLMLQGANKFKTKATELNNKVLEIGSKYDAIISDGHIRRAALEVIKQRKKYWQSKVDPADAGRGEIKSAPANAAGENELIKIIESEILNAAKSGTRTVEEAVGLKNTLARLADKYKDDVTMTDSILTLLKGWDSDIASLATHGIDDLSKAFKEYDEFVANGMMLYTSDIAKKAGLNLNQVGTNLRVSWSDKRTAQSLFDTVIKSGTVNDVKIVKKLVGDQAFADGVELHIRNAFNNAIGKTTGGVRLFNFDQFKKEIGLGKGQSIEKQIFKEALNNEKIVIRGIDPVTGMTRNFSDEMWLGLAPSGRFIDDAAEFSKKVEGDVVRTNVPKLEDFEKLIQVMERTYKHGIPDVSTFMARKAVISSTNRGLTAFLPWSGTEKYGAAATGVLSVGMIKALAGAWLLRYGGGVMSSPVSMRAFRNTIDDTLGETVNVSNFAKLILRHPEEWQAFQMDLLELEDAQQKKNLGAKRMRDLRGKGEKLSDSVMNLGGEILENIPKALELYDKVIPDKIGEIPIQDVPVLDKGAVDLGAEAVGQALEEDESSSISPNMAPATDGFGTSLAAPGSSIAMNTNMNPAAAGALYAGDTDAALAAQYGGGSQYAAQGGIMTDLNPIMDNKGNYTKPQTEINDNPFVNKAKNGGIMGAL